MASKLLALTALFMIAAGGSQMVEAQSVDFSCPKPGTVEIRPSFKIQYTGSSDTDPYMCNKIDGWGKKQTLLFNYLDVTDADRQAARGAFIALLSGREKTVSYDYISPIGLTSRQTWTRLRRQTLTIGGKPVDTIVFEQQMQRIGPYRGDAPWAGDYLHWLDPKTSLWVKGEFHLISGAYNGGAAYATYEDVSVTLPP
jgi:hypothetical protein